MGKIVFIVYTKMDYKIGKRTNFLWTVLLILAGYLTPIAIRFYGIDLLAEWLSKQHKNNK
jgi:hypothetical protein